MTWLDKAIAWVNPVAGVRRAQARHLYQQVRSYDAAASTRRTSGWRKVSGSANAETLGQAAVVRDRARDLVNNNAWAQKALSVIVGNTVGAGIVAQPKAANKARTKRAAQLWRDWAETTACDYEGRHDFYGLQALILQTVARDGECLIRRRRVGGQAIPMQLQVLEPDFLDYSKLNSPSSNNRIIQGCEVDDEGRILAYWLYSYHPGETQWLGRGNYYGRISQRVDVSEVIRVYRQDRAGQLRGVSWFAPVMVPLRDLDDYEDAELVKQKTAACFAAFVHDATGADTSVSDETSSDDLTDKIEPGIIQTLPPGKSITFSEPPTVGGFGEVTRQNLRKVAAGLGVTYEALTGDYSQVNFSSGRMGWIEMGRQIDAWRWRMLIPQLCGGVWAWFTEAAMVAGNDLSGVTATWTAPRREMIDPKSEIAGIRDQIRAGLTSLPEAQRELGFDPDGLLDEIEASNQALDARGITLDSDPRKTAAQGQQQPTAAPAA